MKRLLVCLCLLVCVAECNGQLLGRRRSQKVPEYQPSCTTCNQAPGVYTGKDSSSTDALAEVNAARAKCGLKPFQADAGLNKAAQAAALKRATRGIAGHLPESDFTCVPAGTAASAAGCAAWEPSWGWGACCTYDNYTYAGAAWVMGKDGKRYMHLFVR